MMKKKITSALMVFVLAFSLTAPTFAAMPNTLSPEKQAEVRAQLTEIVYRDLNTYVSLGDLFLGNLLESLVIGLIDDYLDIGAIGEMAGPALGGLLGGLIEGALGDYGIDLPASIDIEGFIGDLLGSDFVTGILASDFVADLLDRVIKKLFATMDLSEMAEPFLRVAAENLAEEFWNNGNPDATVGIGVWSNLLTRWNEASIFIRVGGALLSIDKYVDLDDLDLMSMFDMNILLNVVLESVYEVATEYVQAWIQDIIDQFLLNARNAFIKELNSFFGTDIPMGATDDEIEAALAAVLQGVVCQHSDVILHKLNLLKKLATIFCRQDLANCADRLINCISAKCVPVLVGANVATFKVSATAATADITVTVTADYELDGAPYSKTYTGNYKGAYTVGQNIYIEVGDLTAKITMKKAPAIYKVTDFTIY